MDYSNFCTCVRFRLPWNSLKYKSEYNISTTEFSIYQLLADQAYLVGLNLKLNFKLCEALSYVHGFAFCDGGFASWNAIIDYFKLNNIEVDLETLKINIVKEKVKSIDNIADEVFYGYIDEMFSNNAKTSEVKVVLECYRIIKTLQPLKNTNMSQYYALVDKAIKELVSNSTSESIFNVDLSKVVPIQIPVQGKNYTTEEREEYFKIIEEKFIECSEKYQNKNEAIYYTVYHLINE